MFLRSAVRSTYFPLRQPLLQASTRHERRQTTKSQTPLLHHLIVKYRLKLDATLKSRFVLSNFNDFSTVQAFFFHLSLHLSDSFILSPFLFSSRAFFEIFYFRFRLSPSTGFFNFDSFNLESRLSSSGSSPATGKNIPEERKSARGILQIFPGKFSPRFLTARRNIGKHLIPNYLRTFCVAFKRNKDYTLR